ncbi:hypothetical protein EV178_001897 [Coemansia sp. RSA 1646]|nr:hypothetical protein EV178_001897 [Coemansia sp. RSA 1646]KAJ2090991.1 hypothetical protein IW138_002185 [Coemansia sp. RSA 986]
MGEQHSTHTDTIAAGLQRQLDELRSIIQLRSIAMPQPLAPRAETDSDEQQQQQSEIKKLNNRIKHLVRALDAKDREIQELQAQIQSSR